MQVSQPIPITKFINSNDLTFIIPVYQRNYTWQADDCVKLFEDVIDGFNDRIKHYFGNIVYNEIAHDSLTGFSTYVLIDGQQRITSTMLLLAAIRDEEEDEASRDNITSTYLINKSATEKLRVKLKQVETDRDVYDAIISSQTEHVDKSSIVYRNYSKFRSLVKKAKEDGMSSSDVIDGLKYLEVITIDLQFDPQSKSHRTESPQVIFESINATGQPLTSADLIRNFLLLEIGIEKQEDYYKHYWLTIEKNIGNENISDFIRRYLTLKTLEDVKQDTEYKEYKKRYREYFNSSEDALKELAHYSIYYKWIKHPEFIGKDHESTSKLLQDIDELRMLPATPALMWLLERADNNKIDYKDINKTIDVIVSWSFRARISNIVSSGEIGRILTTEILSMLKNKKDSNQKYSDHLWFELSNYRLRDIYPKDDVFKEAFIRYDFYKSYRKYVQQKLAEKVSNDQTEIVLESIEHIMPQTIDSKYWPRISMNDHAAWVNTIGNLTPLNMPDNIANSNHSFKEKIPNIKNSDWQITRDIDTSHGWGIDNIRERAMTLADYATKIWRSPALRTREIEVAHPGVKTNRNQKFIDWIDEMNLPYIKVHASSSYNGVLRLTSDYLDSIMPVIEGEDNKWESNHAYAYEIKNEASGWTRINLTLNSISSSPEQLKGQSIIMGFLNKQPSNKAWTWFSPIGWTLNFEEGNEVLKDEVKRILEEEVPRFEQELKDYESKN